MTHDAFIINMELTKMPLPTTSWCLDENRICLFDETTFVGAIFRRGTPSPESAVILLSARKAARRDRHYTYEVSESELASASTGSRSFS